MSDEKPSIRQRLAAEIHATGDWLQRVLTHPRDELTRWQAAVRFAYDLGIHGARQLRQDRAPQMASALAFRTLFGLLPLLVVGTILVRAVGGFDQFLSSLDELLISMGLDQMTVEGADSSESLSTWIHEFAETARTLDVTALTWVGLGILAYSAISLLVTIESSFNVICRAPSGRPWMWRMLVYWAVVTIGPAALIATVYVDRRFEGAVEGLAGWWGWVAWLAPKLWSFLATWLVMFGIYRLLPNATVRTRPALIGALVAGLMLEVGKRLLGFYVADALTFRHLYGSLGLIPLFMFWVYVMWLVILFGLEVTSTLQTLAGRRLETIEKRAEPSGMVEPSSILAVMRVVAERFDRSRRTGVRDVVVAAGIPAPVVERMLERLVEGGFLHRVTATGGDPGGYVLARPAGAIEAEAVLRLGQELVEAGSESVLGGWRDRLRRAQLDLAAGETIATMAPGEIVDEP